MRHDYVRSRLWPDLFLAGEWDLDRDLEEPESEPESELLEAELGERWDLRFLERPLLSLGLDAGLGVRQVAWRRYDLPKESLLGLPSLAAASSSSRAGDASGVSRTELPSIPSVL